MINANKNKNGFTYVNTFYKQYGKFDFCKLVVFNTKLIKVLLEKQAIYLERFIKRHHLNFYG